MKQDTSARRQNELLRELARIRQSFANEQQRLDQSLEHKLKSIQQEYESQRQSLSHRTIIQQDKIGSEYERNIASLREETTARKRRVHNELGEKIGAARSFQKTTTSDGEYDWFLAKQRLRKEFETDKLATRENYKKTKSELKAYGSAYTDLVDAAKSTLARHRCTLSVHGGDLIEPPTGNNHLEDHQRTYFQIEELIRQFRAAFWVRFQEDRWFLIVFLIGMVAAAYPLHLWLNNMALTGIATAIAGVISSLLAYLVSRALASKVAHQFRPSFVTAIAAGKKQLLAAQHQNKNRRDAQLKRLDHDTKTRAMELDEQWASTLHEIQSRTSHREQELRSWGAKQESAIQQQFDERQQAIDRKFQPQLDELRVTLQTQTRKLAEQEQEELARCAQATRRTVCGIHTQNRCATRRNLHRIRTDHVAGVVFVC